MGWSLWDNLTNGKEVGRQKPGPRLKGQGMIKSLETRSGDISIRKTLNARIGQTLHRDKLTLGRLTLGTVPRCFEMERERTQAPSWHQVLLFPAHFRPLSFGVDPS